MSQDLTDRPTVNHFLFVQLGKQTSESKTDPRIENIAIFIVTLEQFGVKITLVPNYFTLCLKFFNGQSKLLKTRKVKPFAHSWLIKFNL